MTLSGALNSANIGLSTTQGLSRIAADNVANAMTPGYVRREAVLVSNSGPQGGAIISEVRREVDSTLQRMSRLENGKMAQYQSIQEGLTSYTSYLGQPGDGASPADRFNDFENSLTTLANLPSSSGAQAATVQTADDLARSIRGAATNLGATANDVAMEVRYEVADLNMSLYQLRDLNQGRQSFAPGTLERAQYGEKIDGILDQISGIIDTRVHVSSAGSISIYTLSGAALLEGATVQDVTFNPGDGTLMAGQQDITPFKEGVRGVQHGSLAGLMQLTRETIPQFSLQLDEFARGLIQSFEAADTSLNGGQPGLFTDNGLPFDATKAEGLASRLNINDKVSANGAAETWRIRDGLGATTQGAASDATQINGFLAALDGPLGAANGTGIPSTVSLKDFSAEMVTRQATKRAQAENDFNAASSAAEVVLSARRNSEGVNIDDEMQQLLLIEQSYAANSKILTAVSEMIDTLIAAV